jgi:glycogen synthase kinase 3 beta
MRRCLKSLREAFRSAVAGQLQALHHPKGLSLLHHFISESQSTKMLYLNLVTEYVPETLSCVERPYLSIGQTHPTVLVKLLSYQLLRALASLHSNRTCHRDIKPAKVLLHPSICVLKLCNIAWAKSMKPKEAPISYITSRPYRAPEMMVGATAWSACGPRAA